MNTETVLGGAFIILFGILFVVAGPPVAAYRHRHPDATIWPQAGPPPKPLHSWIYRLAGVAFSGAGVAFLVSGLL